MKVTIQLECSERAAKVLLPLLVHAKSVTQDKQSKWCCFYAHGANDFTIGDIAYLGESQEQTDLLESDMKKYCAVWDASATFVYDSAEETIEHTEIVVALSDLE